MMATASTASSAPKKEGLWSLIRSFLIAVLLAMIVRTFLFEPFHIPSGSMKPTLLIGDYIFVSKYSYGYSRYSIPFGFRLFDGRVLASTPERGDVIVFKLPRDPKTNYIKRLIGLPGDSIQMRNGVLYINGEAVKLKRIDNFIDKQQGDKVIRQYIETLPNGVEHLVLDEVRSGSLDDTGIYHVPEGMYFFMGDNRDNSTDSRVYSDVGFVPDENLVGKAQVIFFSSSGPFWQIWDRIGSTVFSHVYAHNE